MFSGGMFTARSGSPATVDAGPDDSFQEEAFPISGF